MRAVDSPKKVCYTNFGSLDRVNPLDFRTLFLHILLIGHTFYLDNAVLI